MDFPSWPLSNDVSQHPMLQFLNGTTLDIHIYNIHIVDFFCHSMKIYLAHNNNIVPFGTAISIHDNGVPFGTVISIHEIMYHLVQS